MKLPDILAAYSKADRITALTAAGFLIVTIAFADALYRLPVSLGFLYLLPIMIASLYLSRKGIFALGLLCTILREAFGPLEWEWSAVPRVFIGLVAYGGTGLFTAELARRRRLAVQHVDELEEQSRLREAAEEQLRVLIETSPAAILTIDADGRVRLANQAAHQLLGFDQQTLVDERVSSYIPALGIVPPADRSGRILSTTMECRGRRRNGEVFLAQVWLSTFSTPSGPRVAAIVLDASGDLRDREEVGLQRLMISSRVLVRAVSHEIRNLCAAINVVHTNLREVPGIARNEDYIALGNLVEGLGKLVSTELRPSAEGRPLEVDLHEVIDELRMIVEPSFHEEEASVRWEIPSELPAVHADRHGLLHVFMNLANNSLRAMRDSAQKELTVSAAAEDGRVVVRFNDTGRGVQHPDQLFQAFQQAADGAGLGLYLSRALVRAFAGELRHEPQAYGCCFAVELAAARPSRVSER